MKSTLEKAQIMREAAEAVPPFSNLQYKKEHESDDYWQDFTPISHEPNWNWALFDWRIKPDPIAEGHNPDKLTVSQVGEGWRLLVEEEINIKRSPFNYISGIQIHSCGLWRGDCSANNYNYAYRTQQPPGYFLPKPEPKKGVVKMWRYFVRLSDGKVRIYGPCDEDATFAGTVIARQPVEYPYTEGEGL